MKRFHASRLALWLVLGVLAPSCSAAGVNTQVMVTVDAEPGVRSMTRTLVVRVYGGARGVAPSELALLQELPTPVTTSAGWPDVIALAPLDRDASRIYRVEASAYDVAAPGVDSVPVATVRATSGYVPGQTVWLRLLLQDACIGVACTDVSRTCRGGTCVDATIPPDMLPQWNSDGGIAPDGGHDVLDGAADAAVGCTPASCDDHLGCTDDSCSASGCVHVARDTMCSDGNLCTDDHCNGTVGDGCTHVSNTSACDDGIYCNGMDQCTAGTCTSHGGNPCGALTCDETARACTGCNTTPDCPAQMLGSWSACAYSGICALSGTQSRNVRTYTCNSTSHQCTYVDTTTSEPCGDRPTNGMACGTSSCDPAGACVYGSTCDQSGLQPRTCHDFSCSLGTCQDSPFSSPLTCSRNTDTSPCDDGNACTSPDRCSAGACSGPSTCDSGLLDGGASQDAGSCDDGYDCTTDFSDAGMCTHSPNHGYCNYGGPCSTGTCSPGAGSDSSGCVFVYACPDGGVVRDGGLTAPCLTTPTLCDDHDPCTDDSCMPGAPLADPVSGCVHLLTACGPDGGHIG